MTHDMHDPRVPTSRTATWRCFDPSGLYFFMKLASVRLELDFDADALLSAKRACKPALRFFARFLLTALAEGLTASDNPVAPRVTAGSVFEFLLRGTLGGGGSWTAVCRPQRSQVILLAVPVFSVAPLGRRFSPRRVDAPDSRPCRRCRRGALSGAILRALLQPGIRMLPHAAHTCSFSTSETGMSWRKARACRLVRRNDEASGTEQARR